MVDQCDFNESFPILNPSDSRKKVFVLHVPKNSNKVILEECGMNLLAF